MSSAKQHYLALDAARGLAALAVMLYHVHEFIYPDLRWSASPHFLGRSFLAVDLFFLMSGLVIARSYEAKILDGRMSFAGFCKVRLIRLFPLYILGTMAGLTYLIISKALLLHEPIDYADNAKALILNAFFIPDFWNVEEKIFPFDPAAWSLALEWGINLIYAAWAVRRSTRTLSAIAIISGLLLMPLAFFHGSLDMGWGLSTFPGGILRICFSFTAGIIIYRMIAREGATLQKYNIFTALVFLAIVLATPFFKGNVAYDLCCAIIVFPILVILMCRTQIPEAAKSTFSYTGQISYALYILHGPMILWIAGLWKFVMHSDPATAPATSGVMIVGGILVASHIATAYFDEPVRKLLRRRAPELPATA